MKNMKYLTALSLSVCVLVACSHKPPQPYGKPFPINKQHLNQETGVKNG